MTTSTQWQLAQEAAERYQTVLTPHILGPFAKALVDFARLQAGEQVLDVGCGTGAAARYAATAVRSSGRVFGTDVNNEMLNVARALPPVQGAIVEWRKADATQLPFEDNQFDAVCAAQVVQFIPQKAAALAEMRRVVKPHGRVAVSLWCPIEESPYFDTLVRVIATHIGVETAAGLKSAFNLCQIDEIADLLETAGFAAVEIESTQLDLPLPPLAEFVPLHIHATPMTVGFSKATKPIQQAIIHEVAEQLRDYEQANQTSIPFRSHLIIGRK